MTFNPPIGARLDAVLEAPAGRPRGRALEDLVADIFDAVPGVSVADRNVLSGQGDAELDSLLSNMPAEGGLDGFDRDILVECKSSKDPLSSRDLNHFTEQAKLRDLRWSIIVSLAGITGDEDGIRAAQQVIRDNAAKRCGILVIVEDELRAIKSAAHLVNVVERKRQKMVLRMRSETLPPSELRDLDPNRGIRRGGIQEAVRALRRDAVGVIFERALELPNVGFDASLERARAELAKLSETVQDHKESPEHDPMWREVHDQIVEVGAAFVTLFDEPPLELNAQRVLNVDIEFTAPRNVDARVTGDLWKLMADHYLREIEFGDAHVRTKAATAMVSLSVEEIMSINDIDPRDVYDDYEDYQD
jgi:hypothetical protein